jgi:phytoene dehydrogenase-like protein
VAEPVVVLGGSIGALVAALQAARLGRQVDLLVPGGRLGGGFRDLEVDGRRLRTGVRLLELTYGDEVVASGAVTPSLDTYEPGPAGHVPHMAVVRRTILDLVDGDVHEAPAPLLARRGRVGVDVHMTADLHHLRAVLSAEELAGVASEAAAIEATRGPGGVLTDPRADLWAIPLEAASLANHGATFHRLVVEPVAAKVLGTGSADIATALRRKAWLALFHPRTLREAATGATVSYRPRRPFHVDASGGCSAVVDALVQAIEDHPRIAVRATARLVDARRPGHLRFDDGDEVVAERPIVAIPAADVATAVGVDHAVAPSMVRVTWVEVAADDVLETPAAVLLADPDVSAYRLGVGGTGRPGTVLFAIEHGAGPVAGPDDLERALLAAAVVRPGARWHQVDQVTATAGPSPSTSAAAAAAAALDAVADRAPWLHRIGGAAAVGADSWNEQVVAGLHAAHRIAA